MFLAFLDYIRWGLCHLLKRAKSDAVYLTGTLSIGYFCPKRRSALTNKGYDVLQQGFIDV